MPYHVVDALASALNERQKSLKGSKILLLGVAYKKDVDDLRESPSLKLLELLTARGRVKLDYNDPYFRCSAQDAPLRFFEHELSGAFAGAAWPSYDCVLIATDHTQLRLRCHRAQFEAGGGYAQRHAPREAGSRQIVNC